MNGRIPSHSRLTRHELAAAVARWILGGVFLYMGFKKALYPVDFLKVLRQYEMVDSHLLLNFIAATLPWFEVLCGLLLVGGIGVRGAALMSLVMLVPFTLAVVQRALAIHATKGTPFCAISFDCGCGAGEVVICHKLLENIFFMFLCALLLAGPSNRWSLRYSLVKGA